MTVPDKSPIQGRRSGFSLIEVLVAFVLLAFVMTAGIVIFTWQRARLYEQTLWHRAVEAVEEEAETNRALFRGQQTVGDDQPFLTMKVPGTMPVSMRWLPNPVARRDVSPVVLGDNGLVAVVLTLSWGKPDNRKRYQEMLLVLN